MAKEGPPDPIGTQSQTTISGEPAQSNRLPAVCFPLWQQTMLSSRMQASTNGHNSMKSKIDLLEANGIFPTALG